MRWQIHHDFTKAPSTPIFDAILHSRGLNTSRAINAFMQPMSPLEYAPKDVGIDNNQLQKAIKLLKSYIQNQTPIIVYGDYDADGITATAILWETLHHLGANAIPFIPSRELHGYGLSIKGLQDALQLCPLSADLPAGEAGHYPLIITVDNGIVAAKAADWLVEQNIPLIITDHHTKETTLPTAKAIIHSTEISGAGVAWFLAKELDLELALSTLDLVCIGIIADMMPLLGINRSLAKFGLESLSKTLRPGLKALLEQAEVDLTKPLSPYHVNYIIAPRLNAMGRLEHALDSLRLICTKNPARAESLAHKLGTTNRTRQDLTLDLLTQATGQITQNSLDPVIVISNDSFHEGVIGLIAGKLVETYYRPAIVISQKDGVSKASARSIKGVNITNLIRSQSHLLAGVGGHPMAAGFSIETDKIDIFKQAIIEYAQQTIDPQLFEPFLEIDCLVSASDLNLELHQSICRLEPFGIGNKEPVFALQNAEVISVQPIGKTANHKKILINRKSGSPLPAIWFNPPAASDIIKSGQRIHLAGNLSLNSWNHKSTLQLIVKDVVV